MLFKQNFITTDIETFAWDEGQFIVATSGRIRMDYAGNKSVFFDSFVPVANMSLLEGMDKSERILYAVDDTLYRYVGNKLIPVGSGSGGFLAFGSSASANTATTKVVNNITGITNPPAKGTEIIAIFTVQNIAATALSLTVNPTTTGGGTFPLYYRDQLLSGTVNEKLRANVPYRIRFDAGNSRWVILGAYIPDMGESSTTYLRNDGLWQVPVGTVYTHPSHTGEVTGSTELTIGEGKVTPSKLEKIKGPAVLGRSTNDSVADTVQVLGPSSVIQVIAGNSGLSVDGTYVLKRTTVSGTTTWSVVSETLDPNHPHTGEVTGTKELTIGEGKVTTDKINNSAVTTDKIAGNSITLGKLQTVTGPVVLGRNATTPTNPAGNVSALNMTTLAGMHKHTLVEATDDSNSTTCDLKFWVGFTARYKNITSPDPNTLYICYG